MMSGSRVKPWALASLLLAALACAGPGTDFVSPSAPGATDDGTAPIGTPSTETTTLVGAGDIGVCGSAAPIATGRLIDNQPGTVFAAGDLAYPEGTAEQFTNCYDPAWGRQKSRTRPAPGNHEYNSPNAAPYFAYFGPNAGTPGLGYYSYRSGAWQVYSLNSNIEGTRAAAEIQWLRGELAARPSACSVAYFHHPRYSSGPHGLTAPNSVVPDLWKELYNAGAEIIISAHEHFYERFAPQTPDGFGDSDYGIRQFVVGTGGASLAPALRRVANSEVLLTTHGILRLTLEPLSYKWEFLSAESAGAIDSGTGVCHSRR